MIQNDLTVVNVENFVCTLKHRLSANIAWIEEIAFRAGSIDS